MGNFWSELTKNTAKGSVQGIKSGVKNTVKNTRQYFRFGSGGRKDALKMVEKAEAELKLKKSEIESTAKALEEAGADLSTNSQLKTLKDQYKNLHNAKRDAQSRYIDIVRHQQTVRPARIMTGLSAGVLLGSGVYDVASSLFDKSLPDPSQVKLPEFPDYSDLFESTQSPAQSPTYDLEQSTQDLEYEDPGLFFQEDNTTPKTSSSTNLNDLFSSSYDTSNPTSDQIRMLQNLLGVNPTGKQDLNTQNALKSQKNRYSDDGGYFTYYG